MDFIQRIDPRMHLIRSPIGSMIEQSGNRDLSKAGEWIEDRRTHKSYFQMYLFAVNRSTGEVCVQEFIVENTLQGEFTKKWIDRIFAEARCRAKVRKAINEGRMTVVRLKEGPLGPVEDLETIFFFDTDWWL